MILGNHDVKECHTISEHIILSKKKDFIMPSNYYDGIFTFNNNCMIKFIFIDTNLLENNHSCLKKLYNKDKLNDMQNDMIKWLNNSISSSGNIKNIVIVGHTPIITCKNKSKSKSKSKILFINMIDKLMRILIRQEHKNKNFYYICADTHNYQEIELRHDPENFMIKIIIAGTGGAHPDCMDEKIFSDCKMQCKNDIKINNIIYKCIPLKYDNSYGYIVGIINKDDTLQFKYVQVKKTFDVLPYRCINKFDKHKYNR